jgi:hypothetical protein
MPILTRSRDGNAIRAHIRAVRKALNPQRLNGNHAETHGKEHNIIEATDKLEKDTSAISETNHVCHDARVGKVKGHGHGLRT